MDQGSNTSRQAIDATRDAMTDTMAQGKDRAMHTVADVKDSMKDVAQQAKQAFNGDQQAMANVKGTVNDVAQQAKQVFDVNQQVQDRPWMMLGASVAAGYVLGSLGGNDQPSRHYDTSTRYDSPNMSSAKSSQPGMLSDVMDQFRDELDMLKGAAVTTLTNMLRDTLKNNVPQFAEEFERARSEREHPEQTDAGTSQSSQPPLGSASSF